MGLDGDKFVFEGRCPPGPPLVAALFAALSCRLAEQIVLTQLYHIRKFAQVAEHFLGFFVENSHLNHISHVFRTTLLKFLIAKIAKNLIAKIWKPFKRIKVLTYFRPSPHRLLNNST